MGNARAQRQPRTFERADEELGRAADKALRKATTPNQQMTREEIGNTVLDAADDVQKATKKRLRPVALLICSPFML